MVKEFVLKGIFETCIHKTRTSSYLKVLYLILFAVMSHSKDSNFEFLLKPEKLKTFREVFFVLNSSTTNEVGENVPKNVVAKFGDRADHLIESKVNERSHQTR
jgi:hypothetical protein